MERRVDHPSDGILEPLGRRDDGAEPLRGKEGGAVLSRAETAAGLAETFTGAAHLSVKNRRVGGELERQGSDWRHGSTLRPASRAASPVVRVRVGSSGQRAHAARW